MMVEQFSRGGGRGENFSGRLRFFRAGFKLFLEGWNWDFLMGGGVLEVTFRALKNFQRGLRIFGEIKTISSVGVEAFS